ncbi:MAG: DUF4190 domain-containing protein [Microcella sp.]|uniref:DUF4190 domain-containing protein n=1 Tax=Microcella sp. TaxID=1913979 RepID=UPI0024C7933D|nr:DUF4190 domain-containing protein [Microcella sp.]UYN83358.1 MAG: DUF4190 domain-containing protein [Microcella sp.]
MSAVTPEPPPSLMTPSSPPAPAAAPLAAGEPRADLLAGVPGVSLDEPSSRRARREHRPLNALAVAALILAILLSPLAALFGHIAAGQISRSKGRERGVVIAWVAVGLGYLWLVGAIIAGVVIWQVLTG